MTASPIGLYLRDMDDSWVGITSVFESTSYASLNVDVTAPTADSFCSPVSDVGGAISPRVIAPLNDVRPVMDGVQYQRCSECYLPIMDQYMVAFDGKYFHNHCLRCTMCHTDMTDEQSAFVKDGMLLCRNDYETWMRFNMTKTCLTCKKQFTEQDMVMRAGDSTSGNRVMIHVDCFYCAVCRRQFGPGDMVAYNSVPQQVYCKGHLDGGPLVFPPPPLPLPPLPPMPESIEKLNSVTLPALSPTHAPHPLPALHPLPTLHTPNTIPKKEESVSGDEYDADDHFGGSLGGNGNRSKRMRTSFKHHQLRTMKNYFHLNHNPDAKDLKQLAQKTGLTKRVLQVWFQNARAKYRRSIAGRDPASVSPSLGASGSILPLPSSVTQPGPNVTIGTGPVVQDQVGPSFGGAMTQAQICSLSMNVQNGGPFAHFEGLSMQAL